MKELKARFEITSGEKVPSKVIDKYKNIFLSKEIIDLWKQYGFGSFDKGLIKLINPDNFTDTLNAWLGKSNENYVPIFLGAFGELFYYRRLTDDDDDVCMINPHYKRIDNCGWSLESFLSDYLCDDEIIEDVLRKGTFDEALIKNGILKNEDIYMFTPALAMGGSEEANSTQAGNAQVHLALLLQL